MPKLNNQYQKALRARREARGIKRKEFWVTDKELAQVKAFIVKIRDDEINILKTDE